MATVVDVQALHKKLEEIERKNGNQKICVVGVVGKCDLLQKDIVLNQLVNHNIFRNDLSVQNVEQHAGQQCEVNMFYDEEQKTVFLQLNSVHDYNLLFKACKMVHDNLSMAGRHRYWQDQLVKHASALLFMFSVSHIVVVMFPTPRFDLTYLRLFKLLASTRYNMLHSLSQSLTTVDGIPEIWRTTGRPCIPRIIFSFQIPWASAKGLNEQSIRRLQQSLQEQVHLILKKNRLLGSLSSSSLFTVSSPNQLFVHVQSPTPKQNDPITYCINDMLKNSINIDAVYTSLYGKKTNSKAFQPRFPTPAQSFTEDHVPDSKDTLRDFLYKQIDYMMTVESREVPVEGRRGTHVEAPNISLWYRVCELVYEYFLGINSENNSHVKTLAQTLDLDWKFSENRCHKVSPLATNAYLDNLPSHYTQSVHLAQLNHCLRVFTMNARGPAYEHFANQLQEECNQVWWNGRHLCEATSMTGQPCVYPYHATPDDKTLDEKPGVPLKSHSSRVTSISACNCGRTQGTREDPFDLKSANFDFYQELEKKCCSYLKHLRFPSFPSDDTNTLVKPPINLQNNTGPKQIIILDRNDKTALSELSLGKGSIQINIVEEQREPDYYEGSSYESNRVRTISASRDFSSIPRDLTAPSGASLSYLGYQSIDGEPRDEGASYYSEYENMVQATKSLIVKQTDEKDDAMDSSLLDTSTEQYEGMLSINLPSYVLPVFPSWSLIILGSASSYNVQKGVEQTGFFSGSNYLLLWDIPVKLNDSILSSNTLEEPFVNNDLVSQEEQWPAPGEVTTVKTVPAVQNQSTSTNANSYLPIFQTVTQVSAQASELLLSDKNPVGKIKRPNSRELISVKAYIGNEYECPRGHRFFCSAPDKMVKASASGYIRENATKLVTGHMPIYFPCPCRSSQPLHLAQLTRAYVVTPDSAITITLNPRVQPGEKDITPIFYTGLKEGITLPPNSYCVLRFPYLYVDDNGPILPPAPSQPLLTCRLIRGMFNYSYVDSNEENV